MGAIAGIVARAADLDRAALAAVLATMREGVRRRAPIEGGTAIAYDASVGLTHRASEGPGGEAVLQPLATEDGSLWLVADGEPSNAAELRLELIAAGHHFRSACGAEVILHLYEREGVGAFERLAGGFAFALWDRNQRELILGRDRFGEKPLYFVDQNDRFCFASDVAALETGAALAPAALTAYLSLGYVPGVLTIAPAVRALAAGTILRVPGARLRSQRFWTDRVLAPTGTREVDRLQLGRMVREAVQSAVAGEETVGIMLDGALPHAALLSLVSPTLGRGLRTHTLVFAHGGASGRAARGIEATASHARALATWFRSEHREHHVGPTDLAAAFDATRDDDQPAADAALAHLTAAYVGASGDRVWLSGLGAAELLGPVLDAWLPWVWRTGRSGVTRAIARAGIRLAGRAGFGARGAMVAEWLEDDDPIGAAYLRARGLFPPGALAHLLREDVRAEAGARFDPRVYVRALAVQPPGPPFVTGPGSAPAAASSAIAAIDWGGRLMSGTLRDAERASGTIGLALRAPFLDHRLFEWVGADISGRSTSGRAMLADLLASTVPAALRRHLGPPAGPPFGRWMREELRSLVEAQLFAEDPEGLFIGAGIERLWSAFLARRVPWRPVWSLAVLRGWIGARRARLRALGGAIETGVRVQAA